MIETCSQAEKRKELMTDDPNNNRIQSLEQSVMNVDTKLDRSVESLGMKMDKNMADVFAAIRMIIVNASRGQNSNSKGRSGSKNGVQAPYSGITRVGKLDFPRFNEDKVKEWLFKAEQFYLIDQTPDHLKIGIAAMHFDEMAASWHQALVLSEVEYEALQSWKSYTEMLKERFEEILDDPIAELKQLQETDGIMDYHARFEIIRMRVQLSEEYLVSAYLVGLRTDTHMHIRMFQPQSVRQCLMLGRLYEQAHPRKPMGSNIAANKSIGGSNNQRGILPTKKEAFDKSLVLNIDGKGRDMNLHPTKFLTNAEMSDRRANGLCYYCDEPYTPGHYLKHKKTQLYMMEGCEEEGESDI